VIVLDPTLSDGSTGIWRDASQRRADEVADEFLPRSTDTHAALRRATFTQASNATTASKEKDLFDSITRNERLSAIAGRWNTSGHVIGDPQVPVEGTDVYELLLGGHFLVHHVDVTVGQQTVRAIEIIGEPDPESDAFLARSFDSEGNFEVMKLRIDDDGVFHFSGGGDIAPAAQPGDAPMAQVRSTLTVAEDRASMKAFWERSEDGINWQPWMDMTFTRSE
jgi:hypothetical protein